jgi:hypothetical protein
MDFYPTYNCLFDNTYSCIFFILDVSLFQTYIEEKNLITIHFG